MTDRLTITYTSLAEQQLPARDSIISLNGLGVDGRKFRVVNDPELDDAGAFTVELDEVVCPACGQGWTTSPASVIGEVPLTMPCAHKWHVDSWEDPFAEDD